MVVVVVVEYIESISSITCKFVHMRRQWLLGTQGNERRSCTSDYWRIAFLQLQVRKNVQER